MASEQQIAALESIKRRNNVLITGSAGVGKSAVLKQVQDWAFDKGLVYSVTSTTGCSAVLLNCGASTIHSWAGIGIGDAWPKKGSFQETNWRKTDLLIIDEISMLSADMFELLDTIGQELRQSSKLFGGIQIVLAGDFLQLGPVSGEMCFTSKSWKNIQIFEFTKNYRQSDPLFTSILSELRMGVCSPASCAVLQSCVRPVPLLEIAPTVLFSRKVDVSALNAQGLAKCEGKSYIYKASFATEGGVFKDAAKRIERYDAHTDNPNIVLKIGAQVMLTYNLCVEDGLCNGSRGVVVALGDIPTVKFLGGELVQIEMQKFTVAKDNHKKLYRVKLPLILAWALTIHKCQGCELDTAVIDVGPSIFGYGQAYTALSRVRTLHNLYLSNFYAPGIRADPSVLEFLATSHTTEVSQ